MNNIVSPIDRAFNALNDAAEGISFVYASEKEIRSVKNPGRFEKISLAVSGFRKDVEKVGKALAKYIGHTEEERIAANISQEAAGRYLKIVKAFQAAVGNSHSLVAVHDALDAIVAPRPLFYNP